MAHIHTNPGQHDATVSAYIIRLDTPEPSVMLHMHKKLNVYLQFGGHIELNENPWQAITHELKEESGYDIDQLEILQPSLRIKELPNANLHPQPISYQTHNFPGIDHYHTDIAYAFIAKLPPKHPVNKGESSTFKLLSINELRKMSNKDLPEDVRDTCLFILEECLDNWKRIETNRFS